MNYRRNRFIAATILVVLTGIAVWIVLSPPGVDRRDAPQPAPLAVETMTIEPGDYQVVLDSYGTIRPRTNTVLTSQVGGQITWVNPDFRDGGFFETGETMVRIDPRDYQANLKIAEARVVDAERAVLEAQAQADQAQADWDKLGRRGDPSPLVLKQPQLLAAKALLKSEQAALEKAQLELERTEIKAPFAGRVRSQRVDLGQVVSMNAPVADIYAIDSVEIRLPIRNADLPFIDLPEEYRFDGSAEGPSADAVVLLPTYDTDDQWSANLVRTEGAIDDAARLLHVVARVDTPFDEATRGRRPLKIGQYVNAEIQGKVVNDAVVIPNSAIYQSAYVYLVEDSLLRRQIVDIAWQNDTESLIAQGLDAGNELVLTPLGQVNSGMRVNVVEPDPESTPDVSIPMAEAGGDTGPGVTP